MADRRRLIVDGAQRRKADRPPRLMARSQAK
jgi:hypothetical protein